MRWTQGPQVAAVAMVGGVMGGGTRKSEEIRKLGEEETAVGRGLVSSKIWPRHLKGLKIYIYMCVYFPHQGFFKFTAQRILIYTHSVTAIITTILRIAFPKSL